ncbi:tripartite tricarboxylate transporter substrate-binding protein [Caldimonas brevitalea]|uniref:tripartite tricarboxylate transporter substrate-binding protein n=1 Tax=Caldimonas brevitalea TaxID=413882 RepID=UPI002110387B|nr:tripartite tricarboxylate transporter substrate-binding protein [Caldimonas brevitalea]
MGRNHHAHALEMGQPVDKASERPCHFTKSPSPLVESSATVAHPPGTKNLHPEMELVLAIGAAGFRVVDAHGAAALVHGHHPCGLDMTRRTLMYLNTKLFFGALAPFAVHVVQAEGTFPSRPVTLITAFAPGSGPDAVLRLLAEKLGKLWNQRVLVENKPGGAGFIAMDAVKRDSPDGYTLLQLDSEHLAALPYLYKSRGVQTLKTFEPVAALFRTPFLVAVASDSKLKSMSDLVAAARAQPGEVTFGSWGVGSPGHLGGEQLESLAGVDMHHVPYREVSQLFMSVGAHDVAWSFSSVPSSQGAYKAGKLRYLAVAAPERLSQLPEVPTVAEAGGPAGLDVNSFVVLVAPRGLPAAVRDKVNADVKKALAEPDVKARFEAYAFESIAWTPAEIEQQAALKAKVYSELVQRKKMNLE